MQAETAPGSSFLSWREGAGGEESHGEREGVEEALLTQVEGLGETASAPASTRANRCSAPSHGPGAGLGPPRCTEAALSAREVSALTQPPRDTTRSFISRLARLGIHYRCLKGE